MTDDTRLSDEGYVAALAGGSALLLALFGAVGGESMFAVVPAVLAGALGTSLAVRDARGDGRPKRRGFLAFALLAGVGALASLPARRYFTAAGLGVLALMTFARGFRWRVARDEETEG